ncbi:hypothetical protein [Nocardia farcinica]|uniref:hypothetical protein n=1 Tax=Nocardia farcinica TaxID=37329 RepID=UPI001893080B|nr:hypothetical protein [Nocardia farcinica]MBF6254001.1 hypothetical protein [Nocardia farcinica]
MRELHQGDIYTIAAGDGYLTVVIVDGQALLRHRDVALAVPVVDAREMPQDLRIFSVGWDEGRVLAVHRFIPCVRVVLEAGTYDGTVTTEMLDFIKMVLAVRFDL